MQKDWLEDLVVRETMKLIQDDAVIDKIVQLVMDVQNQENTTIPLLEKQLREVNKKLDNLMKAIEDGLYTRTTKERLEALEIQKDELTAKIADEKLKKPSFNEDFIRFWLMKFRKFDISQKKQRKALIEIFVKLFAPGWYEAVTYGTLIVILLVKPAGILGKNTGEKV